MTVYLSKKNIIAFLIACLVVVLAKGMFFNWKSKLTLMTNATEPVKISVEYQKKEKSKSYHINLDQHKQGKFTLKLNGSKTSYIKIDFPSNIQIKKIRYHGLKSKNITLDNTNSAKLKNCYARPYIYDWYNFIVIFTLSFYFTWFLLNAWEHRHDPKEPEKIPSIMCIELIRLILILDITVGHCSGHIPIKFGYGMPVECFFIMTGFFFCLTYKAEKTTWEFIKSKLIHFMPLLIIGSLMCGILEQHISISKMISCLFLIQTTGLMTDYCYVGPAWYLGCMFWVLFFYFYLRKNTKTETFNIITAVITFLSYNLWIKIGKFSLNAMNPWFFGFISCGMIRALAGIGFGHFLCLIYKNFIGKEIKHFKFYSLLESSLLFCFLATIFTPKAIADHRFVYLIEFGILLIMLALKKGYMSKLLCHKSIWHISKYAMAIFLMHTFFAERLATKYVRAYHDFAFNNKGISYLWIIGGSILLGILGHYAIEKPGTRLMKKWLG